MSTTLGNSIQIKGQCYKNGVEISTEDAIQVILEMGAQNERDRIVGMVEDKYVSQIHQKDCEYQREGCDCGYMERSSHNHALDELLANLKSNENTN